MTLKEQVLALSPEQKKAINDILKATPDTEKAIDKLASFGITATTSDLLMLAKELYTPKAPMSDEELENISAGTEWYTLTYYTSKEAVKFLFPVGAIVEVESGFGFGTTKRCTVTAHKYGYTTLNNGARIYCDMYYCQETEYSWWFYNGWRSRDQIEKQKGING